jgi:hypothetical protein
VQAGAESLTIASTVGGDVTAEVSQLIIADSGRIDGNLDYTSPNQASVQGQVAGSTQRHEPQRRATWSQRNPAASAFFSVFSWIRGLVGVLLLGLAVMLVSRDRAGVLSDTLLARPWPSLGFGALTLFAVWPVAGTIFVIGLLIGGWWIAFVLLAVVWLLALLGLIVAGLALGRLLLRWMHAKHHAILAMCLGVLLIWIVGAVPFLGWLFVAAAVAFGLGATLLVLFGRSKKPVSPAETYYSLGTHQPPYPPAYPQPQPPTYPQQQPPYPPQQPPYEPPYQPGYPPQDAPPPPPPRRPG